MNSRWNDRFINLALEVSSWSKDHKQVGCVIVEQETNKVLSLGFNGMPSWFDDSKLSTLNSYDKGRMITHAEVNALNTLTKENYNKDLVMYITKPPCKWCSNFIVNSKTNVKKIYYIPNLNEEFDARYSISESLSILSSNNINVISYNYKKNYTFEIIVADYFSAYSLKNEEVFIDTVSDFIFYCKSLVNNLDVQLSYEVSYIDAVKLIIDTYGYKNLLNFSKNINSVSAKLFLEWYETQNLLDT